MATFVVATVAMTVSVVLFRRGNSYIFTFQRAGAILFFFRVLNPKTIPGHAEACLFIVCHMISKGIPRVPRVVNSSIYE